MKHILSVSLAILFCCACRMAFAQLALPVNKQARAAAWAIDDLKRLESALIWADMPDSPNKGRKVARCEAVYLSYQFLRHFQLEASANVAMEKQRDSGGFIDNEVSDKVDMFGGYFEDVRAGEWDFSDTCLFTLW